MGSDTPPPVTLPGVIRGKLLTISNAKVLTARRVIHLTEVKVKMFTSRRKKCLTFAREAMGLASNLCLQPRRCLSLAHREGGMVQNYKGVPPSAHVRRVLSQLTESSPSACSLLSGHSKGTAPFSNRRVFFRSDTLFQG